MILITGAAGYIGSAITVFFSHQGYRIIALDHSPAFPAVVAGVATECIVGDFADKDLLQKIFKDYPITTVIHCAAFIEVGESVNNPQKYYENNVVKTKILLDTMLEYGIRQLIFSSSCAIYGTPQQLPLQEDHPKAPLSPYGCTKLMVEMMLKDYANAYNFNYIALRYFNAAGAWPEYNLFEHHEPESHIIPRLLAAAQMQKSFIIFGTDYPTPDGTCIRDYLHIRDLADAHWRAKIYLDEHHNSGAFNLGTGNGYSVRQLITAIEHHLQTQISVIASPRRAGDPAILVADATRAQKELKWQPQFSDLDKIISDAATIPIHIEHPYKDRQ